MPPLDVLLDTHVVVWLATAPERLPAKLVEALEDASRRFVSHVSALEIQLKYTKSPEKFPFSMRELERAMSEFSCIELPLVYQDIAALSQMRFLHADPFDRLLMAQAARREIPLATLDLDILQTAHKYKAFSPFQVALLDKRPAKATPRKSR